MTWEGTGSHGVLCLLVRVSQVLQQLLRLPLLPLRGAEVHYANEQQLNRRNAISCTKPIKAEEFPCAIKKLYAQWHSSASLFVNSSARLQQLSAATARLGCNSSARLQQLGSAATARLGCNSSARLQQLGCNSSAATARLQQLGSAATARLGCNSSARLQQLGSAATARLGCNSSARLQQLGSAATARLGCSSSARLQQLGSAATARLGCNSSARLQQLGSAATARLGCNSSAATDGGDPALTLATCTHHLKASTPFHRWRCQCLTSMQISMRSLPDETALCWTTTDHEARPCTGSSCQYTSPEDVDCTWKVRFY